MDARIAAAAVPGFHLVTRARLRAHGVQYERVSLRIRDGRLTPVTHEVLALGTQVGPWHPDTLRMAAVLEAGRDASLFGTTALVRLGAWEAWRDDGSIHVVAPTATRSIPAHCMTFHRRHPSLAQSIIIADRVPTSAAIDACMQAATQQTPHQLAHAVDKAVHLELLTVEALEQRIAVSSGRRGVAIARRAIELIHGHSAGTKSPSEDRALPELAAAFGEPLVNVMGAAGIADYEPDFLWWRERIIVEIDGRPHQNHPITRERDRVRDELLRAAGWIVVRINYRRVWTELPRVVAELRAVFASRA